MVNLEIYKTNVLISLYDNTYFEFFEPLKLTRGIFPAVLPNVSSMLKKFVQYAFSKNILYFDVIV